MRSNYQTSCVDSGHEAEKDRSLEINKTERIVKDYGGSVIFHAGDKIDDLDLVNQSIRHRFKINAPFKLSAKDATRN